MCELGKRRENVGLREKSTPLLYRLGGNVNKSTPLLELGTIGSTPLRNWGRDLGETWA